MEFLSRFASLPLCLGVVLALPLGCVRDAPRTPAVLLDGSTALPPPVVLEGVDVPQVSTRMRVTHDRSHVPGLCASSMPARARVVERTGVTGASVTFFGRGERGVHACDATELDGSRIQRSCVHAFGRLEGRRLRDPRLSITCRDDDGAPVAFAWTQPDRAAAYLAVEQQGYAEVYAASGTTPVRVTTSRMDLATSRATFAISEHARDGALLHSYDLEARVSG